MKFIVLILSLLSVIGWGVVSTVKSISFNQNCGGYLERSANANTVDLATKQLDHALTYLEKNDMTSGYTSVFYRTPDEDVGYWYGNLKASYDELKSVKSDASLLERSNILIKLRETIMHHSTHGDEITVPAGLYMYPNINFMIAWGWVSLLGLVGGWALYLRYGY